mmetsp:Transcript_13893/g.37573  ORF Transcript_13893/g.37573 Transcript_13893/m.37573 type:complete len:395 (-) Transcript_13893:226-1410(-)
MAASLLFQLAAGLAAYSASMACTYPVNSCVTWDGNFSVRDFTRSAAARRLVSLSDPSASRRMYSSGFISNTSWSSSLRRRLGMTMDSQICCSVAASAKSLWCTLLLTVVRKRMALMARLSCPGLRVTFISKLHTSVTKVCRYLANSSSFISMNRLMFWHAAPRTASSADSFSGSASASAGLSGRARYVWNSAIHWSSWLSISGVRPGAFREKKMRNTRRTDASSVRRAAGSTVWGNCALSIICVFSSAGANASCEPASSCTIASELYWLRYLLKMLLAVASTPLMVATSPPASSFCTSSGSRVGQLRGKSWAQMMDRASLSWAWMRGGVPSMRLGRVALIWAFSASGKAWAPLYTSESEGAHRYLMRFLKLTAAAWRTAVSTAGAATSCSRVKL